MIYRFVKMNFKPESKAQFLELFRNSVDRIEAFEGCRMVRLLEQTAQPDTLMTYSIWDSEDHLDRYRRSDFFKQTWTATKALFAHRAEAWSMVDISTESHSTQSYGT
jgi:quinol monooxygenase YgiN